MLVIGRRLQAMTDRVLAQDGALGEQNMFMACDVEPEYLTLYRYKIPWSSAEKWYVIGGDCGFSNHLSAGGPVKYRPVPLRGNHPTRTTKVTTSTTFITAAHSHTMSSKGRVVTSCSECYRRKQKVNTTPTVLEGVLSMLMALVQPCSTLQRLYIEGR